MILDQKSSIVSMKEVLQPWGVRPGVIISGKWLMNSVLRAGVGVWEKLNHWWIGSVNFSLKVFFVGSFCRCQSWLALRRNLHLHFPIGQAYRVSNDWGRVLLETGTWPDGSAAHQCGTWQWYMMATELEQFFWNCSYGSLSHTGNDLFGTVCTGCTGI